MNIDTIFAIYIDNNDYILDRIEKQSHLFKESNFYISYVNNDFTTRKFLPNVFFIKYEGNFSLSAQKNIVVNNCKSDYLLLSDPDFFPLKNFYFDMEIILNIINSLKITPFFIFPVYHANKFWTDKIFLSNENTYEQMLLSFFLSSINNKTFHTCDFIAPYSNVILLSKQVMMYIGGYNENFKGYGSEDFEFMIRALISLDFNPLPDALELDLYQPATKYFFLPHTVYIGFRRLLELYTFSIESFGKKFVHLNHKKTNNSWYLNKDKKRIKFHNEIIKYLKNPVSILDYDWITHKNKIICVIVNKKYWRPFLTLRCKDFSTIRYECNNITYEECFELSKKYKTKNFAFHEEYYLLRKKLISKLENNNFKIHIVKNSDLEEIGIFNLKIDENSYSVSRLNININKKNHFIKNIIYILRKIINHKLSVPHYD